VPNFNSVLIGSAQPEALAAFYAKVFGWPVDFSDGGYSGWQVGSAFLAVGPHSEMKGAAKEPACCSTSRPSRSRRSSRASRVVVKEPYQMEGMPGWIATLADPDGNYFQLMSPMGPM
jgi:predicted enzyme related to lactoylglutathione lyase